MGGKDGFADGPYVGVSEMVGTSVGLLDGDSDGDVVGERIGLLVGEPGMIGEEVGIVEGDIVGCDDVGLIVGWVVGICIGEGVGMFDGLFVEMTSPRKHILSLSQLKLTSQHSSLVSKPLSQLCLLLTFSSTQFLSP